MTGKDPNRGRRNSLDPCEPWKLTAFLEGMWPRASLDHTRPGSLLPPRVGPIPVFSSISLLVESMPIFEVYCLLLSNYFALIVVEEAEDGGDGVEGDQVKLNLEVRKTVGLVGILEASLDVLLEALLEGEDQLLKGLEVKHFYGVVGSLYGFQERDIDVAVVAPLPLWVEQPFISITLDVEGTRNSPVRRRGGSEDDEQWRGRRKTMNSGRGEG
ncbi:hypothetical protein CRG98_003718 [Punica granatum]|uniref:Uncharacterized protein n=1 Tax=Punica granatum TaxID=22663 RepID=A0A2I0L5C0_PUNGR|nr:hypothetical protein CRG98_003718 [Punica granatum]